MPREYERKSERGKGISKEVLKEAIEEIVVNKQPIRKVANARGIDRTTLRRYVLKYKHNPSSVEVGYKKLAKVKRIFPFELEIQLADHIKNLDDQLHGLTKRKCCRLAFELAVRNDVTMPQSWKENGVAG